MVFQQWKIQSTELPKKVWIIEDDSVQRIVIDLENCLPKEFQILRQNATLREISNEKKYVFSVDEFIGQIPNWVRECLEEIHHFSLQRRGNRKRTQNWRLLDVLWFFESGQKSQRSNYLVHLCQIKCCTFREIRDKIVWRFSLNFYLKSKDLKKKWIPERYSF